MVVLAFNPRDVGFDYLNRMTIPRRISLGEAKELLSGRVYHCMNKEFAQAAELLLHKRLGIQVKLFEIEGDLNPSLRTGSKIVIPYITGIRRRIEDCTEYSAQEIRKARVPYFLLSVYTGPSKFSVGESY